MNRFAELYCLISRKEALLALINQEVFVELAKNGDGDAFYHLIKLEQDKLYRIAYVYVQNEDDAIEVFQQSVVKAYEGIYQLKHTHYFSTWLTRIVINCSMTYIEKRKPIRLMEPNVFNELQIVAPLQVEEQLDLWDTLCLLEEKYKTALLLRFYQDYSVKQIATILQCPEGTVKTNIRRGLQALRQRLKGAYIDEWAKSIERND